MHTPTVLLFSGVCWYGFGLTIHFSKMHTEPKGPKGEKRSEVSQIHECDLAKTSLSKQILLQNEHIHDFCQIHHALLTYNPKYGDLIVFLGLR